MPKSLAVWIVGASRFRAHRHNVAAELLGNACGIDLPLPQVMNHHHNSGVSRTWGNPHVPMGGMRKGPADKIEFRATLMPPVPEGQGRLEFSLAGWQVVAEEGKLLATTRADRDIEQARKDFEHHLKGWADEMAHRRREPVTVAIQASALVWKTGETDLYVNDTVRIVDVVREVTMHHGTDMIIGSPSDYAPPSGFESESEDLGRALLDLYHSALRKPDDVVRALAAMAEAVATDPGSARLVSNGLKDDVGFLANRADIGTYSRHPELHRTNHLPEDARSWAEALAWELVNHVTRPDSRRITHLTRRTHPPPSWITDRRPRP